MDYYREAEAAAAQAEDEQFAAEQAAAEEEAARLEQMRRDMDEEDAYTLAETLARARSEDAYPYPHPWSEIRNRYLFNNTDEFVLHDVMTREKFVEFIFDKLKQTNLVFYGGVLRDTTLAATQQEKYYENVEAANERQYDQIGHRSPEDVRSYVVSKLVDAKVRSHVVPNDIDCKFPEDDHENGRRGASARWNAQFDSIVRFLEDTVGRSNVRASKFSVSNGEYQNIDIRVRMIFVKQPGSGQDIVIDVSAPSHIASGDGDEEEEKNENENENVLEMQNALDMDVNGLISYPNKSRDMLDLHPTLIAMGMTMDDVTTSIINKTFTVVASDKLNATPNLWKRVFKRLKTGWIGNFTISPDVAMCEWRCDGHGVAVSSGGSRFKMDHDNAEMIASSFGWVAPPPRPRRFMRGGRVVRHAEEEKEEQNVKVMNERDKKPNAERRTCVVCMDQEPEHMVVGCNHVCICSPCLVEIDKIPVNEKKCPMCRAKMTSTTRVFIA